MLQSRYFLEKFPENPETAEFSKSEPLNQKSQKFGTENSR